MLVLSRSRDQTIMIGDDIEITIVEVRGDKVRLGIRAPSDVSVHRREVWEAIRRENREASQMRREDLGDASGERKNSPNDGSATAGPFARLKKPPGDLSRGTKPPGSET